MLKTILAKLLTNEKKYPIVHLEACINLGIRSMRFSCQQIRNWRGNHVRDALALREPEPTLLFE